MLTFVMTDQYYIFMWVAIAVALIPNTANTPVSTVVRVLHRMDGADVRGRRYRLSHPFGSFCRNGLLAFWAPVVTFFAWMIVMAVLLFKAIALQDEVSRARLRSRPSGQRITVRASVRHHFCMR